MNDYKLPPDDPRLTAYALGELEGDERAAVEAALRTDPALRAAVDEIRATAAQLEAALASEPLPSVNTRPPIADAAAAIARGEDAPERDESPLRPRNVIRFPRLYWITGALAAACFAIFAVVREPTRPPTAVARQAPRPAAPAPAVALSETSPTVEVKLPAPAAPVEITPAASAAETSAAAAVAVATPPAAATPPSAPPAPTPMPTTIFNAADRLSVFSEAKSVEDLANKVGVLGLGQQAAQAARAAATPRAFAVAPVASSPGAVAIEPTAAGSESPRRIYTHPADEGILRDAQPSPAMRNDKTVVRAEPKRPTVIVPAPQPGAPSSAPGSLLDRSTGTYAATPEGGAKVAPDGSMTFSAGKAPPPAAREERVALVPPALPPSSALVESAREALLRPLVSIQSSATAGAVLGQENGFVSVAQNPVSKFTIDAESSSYAAVKRFLQSKRLPPRESVRIEELVNYFPYHYPPPRGDAPFAASLEVADAPWASSHRLVRIGLKAREEQAASRPPVNLVFVVDVVDVERLPSRLPMIKEAIQSLVGKLRPDDRVALVSCRDAASFVLLPTPAAKSREIFDALDTLEPGGATSRMRGLQLAYDLVRTDAISGGNGRVILCTDGNAGITITAEGALARFLEGRARSGVALTAFGFGMGIYRDSLIEFLADYGTGNYGYIDTRRDADKMLAEDINGPAVTIAKDVKVEVEFNPARVASYRLIGYENRALGNGDFRAGSLATDEVSAGHAVTALYEIVPADRGTRVARASAEGLRYQPAPAAAITIPTPGENELLTLKVRYKKPGGAINRKLDVALADSRRRFVDASADFKFAAAVAGFGMVLRDSAYKGTATLANVIDWAEAGAADDPGGYRGEFVELAREADRQVR